jgi:hypothetical protein
VFDGERLTSEELAAGTHMVTSGGAEDGKADRYLADFAAAPADTWPSLVAAHEPRDDVAALVVHHPFEGGVYATVFGQVIVAAPGAGELRWSRTPWQLGSWRSGA